MSEHLETLFNAYRRLTARVRGHDLAIQDLESELVIQKQLQGEALEELKSCYYAMKMESEALEARKE